MNNKNRFISGFDIPWDVSLSLIVSDAPHCSDNKGYAAYIFERAVNGNQTLPGKGPFVAAFGQTNEGDVSPNTKGWSFQFLFPSSH